MIWDMMVFNFNINFVLISGEKQLTHKKSGETLCPFRALKTLSVSFNKGDKDQIVKSEIGKII